MATWYKVQARSSRNYPQSSIHVLYGLDWEDCEGADCGLTIEECNEIIVSFKKDDRLSIRSIGETRTKLPHDYRIVCEADMLGK